MGRWTVPLLFVAWICTFVVILYDYMALRNMLVAILGLIMMAALSGAMTILRRPPSQRVPKPRSKAVKYYYDDKGQMYIPCLEKLPGEGERYCLLKDKHRGPHSDVQPRGYRME